MGEPIVEKGASLHLEGQSAVDSAWYDCEVQQRGSTLFLRFDGYGSEDEEPLRSLDALRFSSIAADPRDCPAIVPGTRVTGFKRSPAADLWIDAEVVGKKAGRHEGGKCSCSFTVQWLATADAGKRAELRIGDLCRLDTRPLTQHPSYERFRAVLEKRAAAGTAGGATGRHVPAPPGMFVIDLAEERARGDDKQQQGTAEEPELLLRPPAGASGPPCALCRLPVVVEGDQLLCSEDVRREFEGKYSQSNVVHKQCAAWAYNSGLRNVAFTKGSQVSAFIRMSFDGAVGEAQTFKCIECGQYGASVRCSSTNCRRWFHLPCTRKCKHNTGNCDLLCPAHAVLGPAGGVKSGIFYGSRASRQAELEGMRSGRLRSSGSAVRLGSLKQGSTLERRRGALAFVEPPRRSGRHADKRVRYNEQYMESEGVTEGWQKDILRRARRGGGSGDEDGSSDDGGEDGIQYMDHSDNDEEVHGGRGRGRQARLREQQPQRELRQRKKVKSYAEEQEELELRELAYKQEQRAKTGYEDTRCEVCHSKAHGKEMLLCDNPGCDRGYHMFCLSPPLEAAPLAFWYCPDCLPEQDCETCGLAVPKTPVGRKRKGGAGSSGAAQGLSYCSECGALCHEACMQEHEGSQRCELCAAGLQDVESILGCRAVEGRTAREYYVKFKDKSYRRCRWITERAVARAAGDKLQPFMRDTRDAPSVEPNVQEQWLQVERVVAMREEEGSGQRLCLVKWRGLEYDKGTWEPREELEGSTEGKEALKKFERRMALRVERDAEAEEQARAAQLAPLAKQPPFLKGVGTLKDYQLEGVSWLLSKLRSGMSAILGDEMGLGKTIQTAVFLQVARQLGLTTGPVAVVVPLSTFGSWEREMAKWAPGLEVLSYSGQQEARALIRKHELGSEEDSLEMARRKLTSLKPRFHVMLTTYDVVIRDTGVLRRFDWSAVVIDEGHSLKGQDSQRGKALREMGAPWRLLLTGTPLQNNLRELLALLAFMADCTIEDIERRVNRMADPNPPAPGEAPDDDEELLQAQSYIRKLHAYLEPRMLRRMKAVCLAGQMPPKITRRLACRMTPLQRQLYKDILAKEWDRVHAMVKNRLEKKSMNNILIRLRQACCHPYLLPGQEPEEYKEPEHSEVAEEGWRLMVAASGKLTVLQQMLPRLLADGHRVLIFSQSVEMLDILEDFLHDFQDPSGLLPPAEEDELRSEGSTGDGAAGEGSEATASAAASGSVPPTSEQLGGDEEDFVRGRRGSVIRYFRLDGKTKGWQRQAMMDSFNSINCKVKVMLISTRAGSLGINLQTANTVVLFDPDFNPFVDAQAEGRAHRLGQEETVMVYQMYTAHSVEERILEVAAKKRKLEELVTKHLGRSRDISDEDIKSSVLHGWGNIMRQEQEEEREGGVDLRLSEAELAALLDREHVFKDDLASGADAAALLGEVRAGGAAAMRFEASGEAEEAGQEAARKAEQDAELARMMQLIEERRRKFEADRAAQEDLGRGRRSRAITVNYDEKQDGMAELLSDEDSPEKSKGQGWGKKGSKRQREDDEYHPALSPGFVPPHRGKSSGENAQPNAEGASRADSGDSSSYEPDSSDSSDDRDAEQAQAGRAALPPQQAQQAQQAQSAPAAQQAPRAQQAPAAQQAALAQQELARQQVMHAQRALTQQQAPHAQALERQQTLALAAQVQAEAQRLMALASENLRAELMRRALLSPQPAQQQVSQPQAQHQAPPRDVQPKRAAQLPAQQQPTQHKDRQQPQQPAQPQQAQREDRQQPQQPAEPQQAQRKDRQQPQQPAQTQQTQRKDSKEQQPQQPQQLQQTRQKSEKKKKSKNKEEKNGEEAQQKSQQTQQMQQTQHKDSKEQRPAQLQQTQQTQQTQQKPENPQQTQQPQQTQEKKKKIKNKEKKKKEETEQKPQQKPEKTQQTLQMQQTQQAQEKPQQPQQKPEKTQQKQQTQQTQQMHQAQQAQEKAEHRKKNKEKKSKEKRSKDQAEQKPQQQAAQQAQRR